jgi:hypothetical protein
MFSSCHFEVDPSNDITGSRNIWYVIGTSWHKKYTEGTYGCEPQTAPLYNPLGSEIPIDTAGKNQHGSCICMFKIKTCRHIAMKFDMCVCQSACATVLPVGVYPLNDFYMKLILNVMSKIFPRCIPILDGSWNTLTDMLPQDISRLNSRYSSHRYLIPPEVVSRTEGNKYLGHIPWANLMVFEKRNRVENENITIVTSCI